MTREERLRLLVSRPRRHQEYAFREMKQRCKRHRRGSNISADELYSEVYSWFMGATTLGNGGDHNDEGADEQAQNPGADPGFHEEPEKDQGVQRLIESATNYWALVSRCADIIAATRRWLPGAPAGTPPPESISERSQPGSDGDDESDEDKLAREAGELGSCAPMAQQGLDAQDRAAAIRGVAIMVESEFAPGDDVRLLAQALIRNPDLWEEFGSELRGAGKGKIKWPIARIVEVLNSERPNRTWDGTRADNAKRRLVHWLQGLMQRFGLEDATDLEAVFAGVGRKYPSAS